MLDLFRFIYYVRYYNSIMKYTPERLQKLQNDKLRKLLHHAAQHSPYYQQKFKGIDLNSCQLRDLPILKKNDMMNHFETFVTDSRLKRQPIIDFMSDFNNIGKYYLDDYVVCHTSGSQGQAAVIVQPKDSPFHLFAMQVARGHAMPKTWGTLFKKLFKKRSRWAMILFKPCFIPSGAAFGYMPKASSKLADLMRLNLSDPFEDNLKKLDEFKPNFITAYVHILEQLARAARNGQTSIASNGHLELVIGISEPLPPETQEYIQKHLGVPVANHYAMGECPQLSLGCPKGQGAHINSDMAILENVDADYNPVPPGTPGSKVLLTNLLNYVQPIIRYEIDDVITISPDPCPCGNKLPLVSAIAGRANDQFWLKTETGDILKMSNFIFKDAFLLLFDLAEYQVIQTGVNQFKVLVEVTPGSSLTTTQIRESIDKLLRHESLPTTIECDIRIVDKIPHDAKSGKLRRFINLAGTPNGNVVGSVGFSSP